MTHPDTSQPDVSGIARMNIAAMDNADLAILHNALAATVKAGEASAEQMLIAVADELDSRGFDTWANFEPAAHEPPCQCAHVWGFTGKSGDDEVYHCEQCGAEHVVAGRGTPDGDTQ